jgi:hypothetical protein
VGRPRARDSNDQGAHDGLISTNARAAARDRLTAIGPDLFASSQGGTVQFARSSKGAVESLLVTGARVQNVKFVRRALLH